MIELRHMDVRHFVIIWLSLSSKRLYNQMWLHRFDVISQSIMSGQHMRYIIIK